MTLSHSRPMTMGTLSHSCSKAQVSHAAFSDWNNLPETAFRDSLVLNAQSCNAHTMPTPLFALFKPNPQNPVVLNAPCSFRGGPRVRL